LRNFISKGVLGFFLRDELASHSILEGFLTHC